MNTIDFATKKRRTRNIRNCNVGYNCGNSCINKNFTCRRKFSDQASTYAGWLKLQAQKIEGKKPKTTKKSLTEEERSQPENLIRLGESFAAKYNLEQAFSAREKYEADKKEFYRQRDIENQAEIAPLFQKLVNVREQIQNYDPIANKGLAKKNELKQERVLLNQELDNLKFIQDQTREFFDDYDRLTYEIDVKSSDWYIGWANRSNPDKTLSDAEVKQLKRQRKKRLPEVEKERQEALDKIPGNQQFKQLLTDLTQQGLSDTQAQTILDKMTFSKAITNKRIVAEIKEDLFDVVKLTGYDALPDSDQALPGQGILIVKVPRQGRAHAKETVKDGKLVGGLINIGTSYSSKKETRESAKTTTFHEFAHHIEFGNQEIALANNRWRDGQATGAITSLNRLSKAKYRSNERAVPDKFLNPYVGKVYDFNTASGIKATEVLSMGVQHFGSGNDLANFYQGDRSHFHLTLGTILVLQEKHRNSDN